MQTYQSFCRGSVKNSKAIGGQAGGGRSDRVRCLGGAALMENRAVLSDYAFG